MNIRVRLLTAVSVLTLFGCATTIQTSINRTEPGPAAQTHEKIAEDYWRAGNDRESKHQSELAREELKKDQERSHRKRKTLPGTTCLTCSPGV